MKRKDFWSYTKYIVKARQTCPLHKHGCYKCPLWMKKGCPIKSLGSLKRRASKANSTAY